MGSDGTASPTEGRDSNAKKRFGQQTDGGGMVMSYDESLVALETGLLKLERDGQCGNRDGVHHGANEIDARMPLRARLQELATFVAWFALIASCTMQYPMVWVTFWNHVQALRVRMGSFHRRTVALPLWGLWVAALFCYRRTIYKRVAPDLVALLLHAEIFACVVLGMTGKFTLTCIHGGRPSLWASGISFRGCTVCAELYSFWCLMSWTACRLPLTHFLWGSDCFLADIRGSKVCLPLHFYG